jgi:DNA-binding beta-propeller fold protein YncE
MGKILLPIRFIYERYIMVRGKALFLCITGIIFLFLMQGWSDAYTFSTDSVGPLSTVKITDMSGSLPSSGSAITVTAWDASGDPLTQSASAAPLTLSNHGTTTIAGTDLAARFPGVTPMTYQFTVASSQYIFTNVKKSMDGTISIPIVFTSGTTNYCTNSVGSLSTLKITDMSGSLSSTGAITVSAWDANGNALAQSGSAAPLTLYNHGTTTITGSALAARFPGGTPAAYQFTVGSSQYIITNVTGSTDGSINIPNVVYTVTGYQFVTQWGSYGTGSGQFNSPFGIAVDASKNVYVADTSNNRIQKFDSSGNFITTWGSSGAGNGQFEGPRAVAVYASGNVYVLDNGNNRIQKFDSSGNFITTWGSSGTGNGQFESPIGIAVNASGNVYVADYGNNRIQKFDSSGNFVTTWGSSGTGNGQFWSPSGVVVDASGNVYVVDSFNQRIQKFSSSGAFITMWGSSGSGVGQFFDPYGVAVDASGNVYVADQGNDRIQKFSSSGAFITMWGFYGIGNGQFFDPCGVAVDVTGNVYVADTENARIQVFSSQ